MISLKFIASFSPTNTCILIYCENWSSEIIPSYVGLWVGELCTYLRIRIYLEFHKDSLKRKEKKMDPEKIDIKELNSLFPGRDRVLGGWQLK